MPVSDAARKLLATRSPAAPKPPPAPAPQREPDRTGFRERAQREAERFRLATDSEYWACLCFRTPAAAASFARATRADGRYVAGATLPAPQAKGSRAARMLAARAPQAGEAAALLSARPAPDPLASLPEDDPAPLEQASLDELDALLTALTAPPDPSPPSVLDSPHWVAAWWPHRDAKDAWLAATGLDVLGDKYLDGHQAARLIGINLKEG